MIDVNVYKIAMNSPYDISELKKLIEKGQIDPDHIVAVLAKTEGNGCVNDFTRGYSTLSFRLLLSNYLNSGIENLKEKIAFVMSGGTEGVMSPHATIFSLKEVPDLSTTRLRLSIGIEHTRDLLPEELGTINQVNVVAESVKRAMVKARISNLNDVHFVQIKCPLLTTEKINAAEKSGNKLVVNDTYKSMAYSRAASALGVALALNEIEESHVSDEVICKDWSLYSKVASVSAGEELDNCEIILMGNSKESASKFIIGHGVMKDAIDLKGLIEIFKGIGLDYSEKSVQEHKMKIINVFAKAEADPSGYIRGKRHTMLTDSDINHTRHARAVVNAVIAAYTGDSMVYVSGGAEHQGPAGGGPVAVIAALDE